MEEIGYREHDLVGFIRRSGNSQRRIVGQVDRREHPLAILEIEPHNLAHHIVKHADEQRVAGNRSALPGLAFTRCPYQRLFRAVGISLPFLQIDRDQRVRREYLALRFPIDIGREQDVPVDNAIGRCLEGNVEPQPFTVLLEIVFGLMEAHCAEGSHAMDHRLAIAQQTGTRPHVFRRAAEDFRCIIDAGAAFPFASGIGIFAFGLQLVAEVTRDEERIPVNPLDVTLAFGQFEPAPGIGRHEAFGVGVEFAQHGGVLAAIG